MCAFVKWHGLRLLEDELERLRATRGPLRVITTTYMGATERAALDRLVREFGAEVKIQYDAAPHPPARQGLDVPPQTPATTRPTSAPPTSPAPPFSTEWSGTSGCPGSRPRRCWTSSAATFDTYWNDPSFELYDPDVTGTAWTMHSPKPRDAAQHDRVTICLSGLEVRPFPYQQQMLDALDGRARRARSASQPGRRRHRHRQDRRRRTRLPPTVLGQPADRPRCSSSRTARRSSSSRCGPTERSWPTRHFGELYVGGARPERWHHVFASVQSLHVVRRREHPCRRLRHRGHRRVPPRPGADLPTAPRPPDPARAARPHRDSRARRRHRRPRRFFDGRTATELRLWDALGKDLLCPFHYFAVADGTDLRRISWTRGRYDEGELSNVYTGNQARAAIVLQQLRDKVIEPRARCARSASASASPTPISWRDVSPPPASPHSRSAVDTPRPTATQALEDLASRRVNVLFAADLFNEGLDLPDVDTVLFLRPTESATIFLQQLGRGLRRTPDKAVLTVLDFVGHQRQEFRFDKKLRALTGETRAGLEREIERGFPFLPSGCQIVMDRQAQALILENLRTQVANSWKSMAAELRSYGDLDLPTFVHESGHRAGRHPAPRPTILDPAPPRRRPADPRWLRARRVSCSSGSAPSPTSTTDSARPATASC